MHIKKKKMLIFLWDDDDIHKYFKETYNVIFGKFLSDKPLHKKSTI